ncbi:MAG: methionine synthase [Corynebacterium sp.]|nr:methionine synthase [Corynebacterium sp.]
MVALGLGPLPETDVAQAADVVAGELVDFLHIPQLPARGLSSNAVAQTAGLLESLSVDIGPRAWQLSARPQRASHEIWDTRARDLDTVQEVWGEDGTMSAIKVQVMGPLSLAASLELANGHRVLEDAGAHRDLRQELHAGVEAHRSDIASRFHLSLDQIQLQLNEPLLSQILAGMPGTNDFDPIRPVPAEVAIDVIANFSPAYLNIMPLAGEQWQSGAGGGASESKRDDAPQAVLNAAWEVALNSPGVIANPRALQANLDKFGHFLDEGKRLVVAVTPWSRQAGELRHPRQVATNLAHYCDTLGHSRQRLADQVDVAPWPMGTTLIDAASAYRWAVELAGMIERDAGDL